MVHARNSKRGRWNTWAWNQMKGEKSCSFLQMQRGEVIKCRQIWQGSQKCKEVLFVLILFLFVLILFPFARCHVCWCMQICNVYMDSTIIFYFLFYRDSSIIWQAIFNQGDVVGSQAWVDGRIKTNVAQKNVHTLFFLAVGDMDCLNHFFYLCLRVYKILWTYWQHRTYCFIHYENNFIIYNPFYIISLHIFSS